MNAAGARLVKVLKYPLDLEKLHAGANRIFKIMDDHLANRDFLALDYPTIADIACFPYTALAGEGGIDLAPYKNILRWIANMKKIPGFITMPGIEAA
ncbi:glutathione binding-like protein [uncultured Herbaspirillum sp.]|uniref:glutathione binding-like protein n=1 Tax=uncultured Herbaspirillum sp. TaxID=160236 RepID=UPI00261FB13E|nr:glutathione binding-like protein [uncultured Herbaspirillum sp.]